MRVKKKKTGPKKQTQEAVENAILSKLKVEGVEPQESSTLNTSAWTYDSEKAGDEGGLLRKTSASEEDLDTLVSDINIKVSLEDEAKGKQSQARPRGASMANETRSEASEQILPKKLQKGEKVEDKTKTEKLIQISEDVKESPASNQETTTTETQAGPNEDKPVQETHVAEVQIGEAPKFESLAEKQVESAVNEVEEVKEEKVEEVKEVKQSEETVEKDKNSNADVNSALIIPTPAPERNEIPHSTPKFGEEEVVEEVETEQINTVPQSAIPHPTTFKQESIEQKDEVVVEVVQPVEQKQEEAVQATSKSKLEEEAQPVAASKEAESSSLDDEQGSLSLYIGLAAAVIVVSGIYMYYRRSKQ